MVSIRKPYEEFDEKNARRPQALDYSKDGMTKQSMAKDMDVNNIIKKYNKTNTLQKMLDFEGVYGEFDTMDYRDAIEMLAKADALYQEVPSNIRAQFDNDPGQLIDFITDPNNLETITEWGLAKPKVEERAYQDANKAPVENPHKEEEAKA